VVDGGMRAVVEALEAAERVRLIGPVPGRANRYRFAATLIRSSIYEDMPTSRRRWLHRDVGLALERLDGTDDNLSELAVHFGEAAAVGEADRAVSYARKAADAAVANRDYEQAAAHYARARAALELTGSVNRRLDCDLLLAQATALCRIGGDDYRKLAFAAADTARAIGDAERLANAALLLVHIGPANPVVDAREVSLMEEALAGLDDTADSPVRARLLAGLGSALSVLGRERTVSLSRQAADMARRLGDPMVLARVLASHHASLGGPDDGEERLEVAHELVLLGEQLNDPEITFAGHIARYMSLVAASDIEGADAALDAGDRLARELRQPLFAFHIFRVRAAQAMLAGRVAEGERLVGAMMRKGREANVLDSTLGAMFVGYLFLARDQQGRLPELEPDVSRLAATRPEWLLLQAAQAQLHCLTGRPARGRALLGRLAGDGFRSIPRDDLWFETTFHLAAIAVQLADTDAVAALYDLLQPYRGLNTFSGMGSFGPVDRILAQLATALERYELAEQHFAAAADLCDRLRAPGWAAHVRHGWARMLRARGLAADNGRIRELLVDALVDADQLELTGLADQLRAMRAE
jgi:hypothetical protein